jgi:hypothetical protein
MDSIEQRHRAATSIFSIMDRRQTKISNIKQNFNITTGAAVGGWMSWVLSDFRGGERK